MFFYPSTLKRLVSYNVWKIMGLSGMFVLMSAGVIRLNAYSASKAISMNSTTFAAYISTSMSAMTASLNSTEFFIEKS